MENIVFDTMGRRLRINGDIFSMSPGFLPSRHARREIYSPLTLLELQYRFGDKPVKLQVVCPQNGTAV